MRTTARRRAGRCGRGCAPGRRARSTQRTTPTRRRAAGARWKEPRHEAPPAPPRPPPGRDLRPDAGGEAVPRGGAPAPRPAGGRAPRRSAPPAPRAAARAGGALMRMEGWGPVLAEVFVAGALLFLL